MFLGLEWYWWILMIGVLIIAIPFKIKFMKRWSEKQKKQKQLKKDKWGDEDD